jgi:hypothetical protein
MLPAKGHSGVCQTFVARSGVIGIAMIAGLVPKAKIPLSNKVSTVFISIL